MKLNLFLLTCFLLNLPYSLFSQEYGYTHYDVKDGLAGSNVYCITQDKEGFLWMGTEGGVSRFDGTHFKNFNLEDGLPDIEVLQIFADSKGRVWMAPFSKSICYYYQGRIHNQDNDSLLRLMSIKNNIEKFAEDRYGNVMIQERTVLHLIGSAGGLQEITTINGQPIDSYAVAADPEGQFFVQHNREVYRWSGGKFSYFFDFQAAMSYVNFLALSDGLMAWKAKIGNLKYRSLKTGKTISYSFDWSKRNYTTFSLVGDSLIYRNEAHGTEEFNFFTGTTRRFMTGIKISRTFRDDEGYMWYTSLGQGIFRLNSDQIRNIPLFSDKSVPVIPYTIMKEGNELWVGGSSTMVFRFELPSLRATGRNKIYGSDMDEVRFIQNMKDGRQVMGTSMYIIQSRPLMLGWINGLSIKSAQLKNDSEILAGGYMGVILVDAKTLHVKEKLWPERATGIYYLNDTTYIGGINGLYILKKDKSVEYWGSKDPILRKRISSIARSLDGTLWIATYGGGIIAWRNGRKLVTLTRKQGLSSDLCSVLQLNGNKLWVGTDKGLNKVDIGNPDYPVTSYTANDGLSSDIITSLYADSSMVFAGTPAGLSVFDANHVDRSAGCRLVLLDLVNSGKDRLPDTAALRLPYTDNNIRFGFAGISFKSAENIWYHFRLQGLDSVWKTTKESYLEYPSLPSGDYELQLQAINKFGIRSRMLSVRFTVATPFWRTAWFEASVLVLFLGLTWLFVTMRIKNIRRRQDEQEQLNKRMAETEHMALQAQMNPHFIFNCLNSIQQYIFDQDIFAANKYITGFAKLIRATLHNSSQPFIPLADEMNYLSNYLSLEKLRFKEKMSYTIEIEPSLQPEMENIYIPPMLIQPYVENCMRHGLRHKMGGGGYIRIKIMQEGDKLAVVIEDNGIGRVQAGRYKTGEHIEYQSKGMSLTADRIRLMNTVNGETIRVEVIDLMNAAGDAKGTRVIVRFPRYDLFFHKNSI